MTRARLIIALLAMFGTAGIAAGEEPAATRSLPDMVRNLARLQDATAHGSEEAAALQGPMRAEISAMLRKADPVRLPEEADLRAAIIHLLSGGAPEDADVFLRATPHNDPQRWLLQGAVYYSEGDSEKALKIFQNFSPDKLPVSVGGRIALATATLLPESETVEKARLLNYAVRFMPGTLVEEAALRRLNAVSITADDPLQFQITATRYIDRYQHSIFAADFILGYISQLVAFEGKKKPVDRLAFEVMMNKIPRAQRLEAYLKAARLAAPRGLSSLTLFCASRARRLAEPGTTDWHAATLFDASVLLTGGDYDIAMDLLHQVDPAHLDSKDDELYQAVMRMADSLRAPADKPAAVDERTKTGRDAIALPPDQQALADKVNAAISAADETLKAATQ